jgi:hypothetical protein
LKLQYCFTHILFGLVSQTQLQLAIQKVLKSAYAKIPFNQLHQSKATSKNNSEKPQAVPTDNVFFIEKNFDSLLPTIVLFINQEPFSNVAMNLDVNFWHVQQENLIQLEGPTIKDAIFEKGGDTFQNSPIYLLFYEKISKTDLEDDLVPTLDEPPELSSMSWCRLKQNLVLSLPEMAFDKELLLIMQDVTAQFVTKE